MGLLLHGLKFSYDFDKNVYAFIVRLINLLERLVFALAYKSVDVRLNTDK